MASELKVSVAAFGVRKYRALADFRDHVQEFIGQAKQAGSNVLVLPELTCIGLLWTDPEAGSATNKEVAALYRRVLTPLLPEYERTLSGLARAHGVTLVGASYWHEVAGKGVNTAFVFRPDGEVLRQDKLHMTRAERAIDTVGGNSLLAFDLHGIRCGLYICYDVQFPELARILVDRSGIEVLFVPSLTDRRGIWRIWHSAHARALENQMFVCVSTLVGSVDVPVDYRTVAGGRAFVACPIDNRFQIEDGTYARSDEGEALVSTVLDLETLRASRAKSEIRQLADRRQDLYALLAAEAHRGGSGLDAHGRPVAFSS